MAQKKSKSKKQKWFIAVRGSYLPASWQGWATYVPFSAYLVATPAIALAYTGNNLKAILWVVPNWVAAAVVMTWVAKRTS